MKRLGIAGLLLLVLAHAAAVHNMDNAPGEAATRVAASPCSGSFSLPSTKLKDHTIFRYADYYYLAATRIQLPSQDGRGEYKFAYARSQDMCTWEDLGTVLEPGAPGDADESYIWAPFVIEQNGVYFMFYTGVNHNIAQSIMLATSTNPSDPLSWTKHGVVFRPQHADVIYSGPDAWSDARDPMVLFYSGRYYLYYTGRDSTGGIVGIATAKQLLGPWQDLGAVLRSPAGVMPESPFAVSQAGYFYLYYNVTGQSGAGEVWQWAPSPFGPWQPAVREYPGWAHDFYFSGDAWYASYVVGNGAAVGVTPIRWNTSVSPPSPQIGWQMFVPSVMHIGSGKRAMPAAALR